MSAVMFYRASRRLLARDLWGGLEARVIHLTDLGRAVSRDLDVKYMAVVTEKCGVCSRCPL